MQCPACQTTFTAPDAPPPLALPVAPRFDRAEPPPVPEPSPPPRSDSGSSESPFDFAPDAEELAPYIERRRLQTAVGWLSALVAVEAILSLICCVNGCSIRGGFGVLVALGLSTFLLYVPLVFVCMGANAILKRRSWGLAMIGAVVAIVLGALNLLLDLFLAMLFLGLLGTLGEDMPAAPGAGCALVQLILEAVLLSLGAIGGLLGGIYAVRALNRYEIRRMFR